MNLLNYKIYRGAWLFQAAPHKSTYITKEECKTYLKLGGFLVRNCYDFDTKEETSFWYVLKDSFGGMEELPTKVRNQIRRAIKTLDIRIINKEELILNGFNVHRSAFENYRIKSEVPTKESFVERINNCGNDYQFWGCYHKESNELVAFSINRIYDEQCNYETFKANPEFLRGYYPLYGLIFEMNRYYLEEMKLLYVCDGARSITNHSNIQPFLEKNFKFRKSYCKLQIEYVWWLNILVKVMYPFRKYIPIPNIKAVLDMEEMKRSDF
jgi:hypothetical protein